MPNRHCYIMSPGVNEPYAHSSHKSMNAFVLLAAKSETSPTQYPKLGLYFPGNSSVTHDIAKIYNYSVYRRLCKNFV